MFQEPVEEALSEAAIVLTVGGKASLALRPHVVELADPIEPYLASTLASIVDRIGGLNEVAESVVEALDRHFIGRGYALWLARCDWNAPSGW